MNSPTYPADELFDVELRIAQRADELARQFGVDPEHALDPWRQAEREILFQDPEVPPPSSFHGRWPRHAA